jgi:hypothetical protein
MKSSNGMIASPRYNAVSVVDTSSMGRWSKSLDSNHAEVKGWYEDLFVSVADCAGAGFGVPDLFVAVCGITHAVEIKVDDGKPAERKLNDNQKGFFAGWRGRYRVVATKEDVIAHVQDMRREAREVVK